VGGIACLPLSNHDINHQQHTFDVYPNPASTILNIKSSEPIEEINIYDMQGRMLLEHSNTATQQINISKLSPGNYYIKADNGAVRPFVKF
jgi:hypothetical protein